MYEEQLFWQLFKAPIEGAVEKVLTGHGILQSPKNWLPYGKNESNFAVVRKPASITHPCAY